MIKFEELSFLLGVVSFKLQDVLKNKKPLLVLINLDDTIFKQKGVKPLSKLN